MRTKTHSWWTCTRCSIFLRACTASIPLRSSRRRMKCLSFSADMASPTVELSSPTQGCVRQPAASCKTHAPNQSDIHVDQAGRQMKLVPKMDFLKLTRRFRGSFSSILLTRSFASGEIASHSGLGKSCGFFMMCSNSFGICSSSGSNSRIVIECNPVRSKHQHVHLGGEPTHKMVEIHKA
eukprot:COSAG02_NODE_8062_length_2727_cov_1.852740_1_plen_180_part_00